MPLAVNETTLEVRALAEQWKVLDALMGGTPAMRKASTFLLPKWPAEEDGAYAARLATATLFPAYRRTVSVMAGKPFAKALTIKDADERIETWCEDVDLQGVNLHVFAGEMFEESFYGLAGILVEYPRVPPGGMTVAQAERAGLRPYMVRIRHDQIIGWRTGMIQGRLALTQLRLREDGEVDDGAYGTKAVERVRVLMPGAWELWERGGQKNDWVLIDKGTTSLPVIPFVPIYGRRRDFMKGWPTLLDLAYLNVKHWQSQSDQDNILHAARVPILVRYGTEGAPLVIGAGTAMDMPAQTAGAAVEWVEHSGAAIGAGRDSITDLEEQMIQSGAELLVKQPGTRSATEASGDQEGNKCDLQRLTEQMEDSLDQALVFMAAYGGVPVARAGSAALFKDFGVATLSDASAQLVADLNSRGLLSSETVLRELQRRGVLDASVDVDAELAKAREEGPALGELGGLPDSA